MKEGKTRAIILTASAVWALLAARGTSAQPPPQGPVLRNLRTFLADTIRTYNSDPELKTSDPDREGLAAHLNAKLDTEYNQANWAVVQWEASRRGQDDHLGQDQTYLDFFSSSSSLGATRSQCNVIVPPDSCLQTGGHYTHLQGLTLYDEDGEVKYDVAMRFLVYIIPLHERRYTEMAISRYMGTGIGATRHCFSTVARLPADLSQMATCISNQYDAATRPRSVLLTAYEELWARSNIPGDVLYFAPERMRNEIKDVIGPSGPLFQESEGVYMFMLPAQRLA